MDVNNGRIKEPCKEISGFALDLNVHAQSIKATSHNIRPSVNASLCNLLKAFYNDYFIHLRLLSFK